LIPGDDGLSFSEIQASSVPLDYTPPARFGGRGCLSAAQRPDKENVVPKQGRSADRAPAIGPCAGHYEGRNGRASTRRADRAKIRRVDSANGGLGTIAGFLRRTRQDGLSPGPWPLGRGAAKLIGIDTRLPVDRSGGAAARVERGAAPRLLRLPTIGGPENSALGQGLARR